VFLFELFVVLKRIKWVTSLRVNGGVERKRGLKDESFQLEHNNHPNRELSENISSAMKML